MPFARFIALCTVLAQFPALWHRALASGFRRRKNRALYCAVLCSFFILFSIIYRSYRIKKTTRSPRFLSKDLGRFILVFYDALNRAVSPARQLFAWGFFCPWGGKGLCKGTAPDVTPL